MNCFIATRHQVPTLIGCNLLKNLHKTINRLIFLASPLICQQRRSEIVAAFSSACQHFAKKFFENLFKLGANFSQRPFYRSFVLDRLTNQQPSQRLLQNFKPLVNTWIENFFATQTQHPSPTEPH
ncbi:MAG: hypothetical protein U1E77_17795 [Inhella sp.]